MIQAQTIAAQSDKRQRQFDKSIDDWKRKVTDLQASVVLLVPNPSIHQVYFRQRVHS